MGKQKLKKKSKINSPTGLISVKQCEDMIMEHDTSPKIPEMIYVIKEQLQSAVMEEKENGCLALAHFISQPSVIDYVLNTEILPILMPLMVDKNNSISLSATGALRNMSVDGGASLCVKLVDKDILTPLFTLIAKHVEDNTMERGEDKNFSPKILFEAFNLLWNLCEASAMAISLLSKSGLILKILPFVSLEKHNYELSITAAQLLHIITEDCEEVATLILKSDNLNLFLNNIERKPSCSTDRISNILLHSLSAGILINLNNCDSSHISSAQFVSIIKSLIEILSYKIEDTIIEYQKTISNLTKPDLATNKIADGKMEICEAEDSGIAENSNDTILSHHNVATTKTTENECERQQAFREHNKTEIKEINKSLSDVKNLCTAQQIVLAVIANLCCINDDDSESWADSYDSDNEDCSDSQMDLDQEMLKNPNGCFNPDIVSLLQTPDLLSKVLEKCEANDCLLNEDDNRHTINTCLDEVKSRALLCLSNIFEIFDSEDVNFTEFWPKFLNLLKLNATKCEILEGVTSVMRNILNKKVKQDPKQLINTSCTDLLIFHELILSSTSEQLTVNCIRCLSLLGSAISLYATDISPIKDIGSSLITILSNCKSILVKAEAVDAIFDVFAEDNTDFIAKDILLTDALKCHYPSLKKEYQSNRKFINREYPIVSTVLNNLQRFIKYKARRNI